MNRAVVYSLIAVSSAAGVGGAIATRWYNDDRAGMLSALCEAGLPNFSRPSVVRKSDLGCTILSEKIRVKGTLTTGFELSTLRSAAWADEPVWHTCNQASGCDPRVDAMLERNIPGICVGLAEITTEGWVTETPGGYGHMNLAKHEFYEDRVIDIKPPSPDVVRLWREVYSDAGITTCDGL